MKTITIVMWDPAKAKSFSTLQEKIAALEENFIYAYQQANEHATGGETPLVLFLCPEFSILNDTNTDGSLSYTKAEMEALEHKLQQLTRTHENSIIIPGSGNIKKNLDLSNETKFKRYANALIKQNQERSIDTVAALKTALNNKLKGVHFVKNTALLFSRTQMYRYSKKHPANEMINDFSALFYPGHASNILEIQGMKLGIEICYDHYVGALRKEQISTGDTPLDVHIIISNTIGLCHENIANARKNVLVINCAGNFTNSDMAKMWSSVWHCNDTAHLTEMTSCYDKNRGMLFFYNVQAPENEPRPNSMTL